MTTRAAQPSLPLRRVFARARPIWARVTPRGFKVGEQVTPNLEGRVVRTQLLRKLFEAGDLVCDSPDGETASDGTVCEECCDPRCRPQLRIWLAGRPTSYMIDLATTSALNLLAIQDELHGEDQKLSDCTLALTVVNRGTWGEVVFEPIDS